MTVAALAPPALVSLSFPDGREGPFPSSPLFWPVPLFALAFLSRTPGAERTLRIGAVLYALAAVAAFVVTTPMGGNAVRLGALVGGPLLLCAIWGRPWTKQLVGAADPGRRLRARSRSGSGRRAVRDVIKYIEDPAAKSNYFEPLREFLFRLPDQRRIEIPFTRLHWEDGARGPRPRLDRPRVAAPAGHAPRNKLFYEGRCTRSPTRPGWARTRSATSR